MESKAFIQLSVIIPVYNARAYLRQCLDSVIKQSKPQMEIICVDDGSTDDSLAILKEYRKKDNRIKILEQKNLHAGIARNHGLSKAQGVYVHFLDADDWVEEGAYKKWYACAKEREADICWCLNYYYDNESGELASKAKNPHMPYISESNLSENPEYFLYNAVVAWNKIYRRTYLLENAIYFDDLLCANDRFFYFKNLLFAKKIVIVQDHWITYRLKNATSVIGTTRLQNYHCHFSSFEKTWEMYSKENSEIKKAVLNAFIIDFFHFYQHAQGGEFEQQVKEQLSKYLKTLDLSLFGADLENQKWYGEFLALTATKDSAAVLKTKQVEALNERKGKTKQSQSRRPESINRIKRFVSFPLRKLKGAIRCLSQHGWRYTATYAVAKATKYAKMLINPAILEHDNSWGLTKSARAIRIIVSLTSFPARIQFVHKAIETILQQTLKPDMVILWLADEQFPKREKQLPSQLLQLKKRGLTIRWCQDWKSYKKLIPTLKEYPDDIIVTADDDAYYSKNWLEGLYNSYSKEKAQFIHCHRITKLFYVDGEWHTIWGSLSFYSQPTYLHKLVGLGGVLYPPHCLHDDVIDDALFTKLALTNDDLWFWFMAIRNNYKIKIVENNLPAPKAIKESRESPALTDINDCEAGLFWQDFENLLAYYPKVADKLEKEYCLMRQIEQLEKVAEQDKTQEYYRNLDSSFYPAAIMLWYYQTTGKYLNLDNLRTFNEKIQGVKLCGNKPIMTLLSDKYQVRSWVEKRIGAEYLVPLLGVWKSFDAIDFSVLPPQFVLKANHGCGWNIIVTDKEKFNIAETRANFAEWLKTNFAFTNGFELQYRDIAPLIIAEEYLCNKGSELFDYKVFCFKGKARYIMFLANRQRGLKMAFFDTAWKRQKFVYSYPLYRKPVPKPKCLKEMIALAEKLSVDFAQVRVDFYITNNNKIKFGELTFTSASGSGDWRPEESDLFLGTLF